AFVACPHCAIDLLFVISRCKLDFEPGTPVTSQYAYRTQPVRGKGRSPPAWLISIRTFFQPAVRTPGVTRKEGIYVTRSRGINPSTSRAPRPAASQGSGQRFVKSR